MNKFLNECRDSNIRGDFLLSQRNLGYGYANIGQLFALAEIAACAEELEDYLSTIPREKNIYASHLKYKQSDVSLMPKKNQGIGCLSKLT
jgi:hypothetical protein